MKGVEEDIFTLSTPVARSTSPTKLLGELLLREEGAPPIALLWVDLQTKRGKRVVVPAAVRTDDPSNAMRCLRVAVNAAYYAPLIVPPSLPPRPVRGELGAVVFGLNGTISCAFIFTEGKWCRYTGAARGGSCYWGVEMPIQLWWDRFPYNPPPPSPFDMRQIDTAVSTALLAAAPPPLSWLKRFEEEVWSVELKPLEVGGRRFLLPCIPLTA